MLRTHGRASNEMRPIFIEYDVFGYAQASVILKLGNTKVLCSVSLQQGVPSFLKGKKTGWLKAEYAMLPTATHNRTQRESTTIERNGRSVEISRLIGRVLRSILDLDALGENTLVVDCDVLQADGGTRTACITGASQALHIAIERWIHAGILSQNIMQHAIAAVSVGVKDGAVLLDIDFAEDSSIDADFNFVFTATGDLLEVQGTAEKKPISPSLYDEILKMAWYGAQQIFSSMNQTHEQTVSALKKISLFSLQNRLNHGRASS